MFENPSYIQSDYITELGDNHIAGDLPNPDPRSKFQEAEIKVHREHPDHYKMQYAKMPSAKNAIPYSFRSDVAPYTLNYQYANQPESMAITSYGGLFDSSESSKISPFTTSVATSSLILLGAVVGELLFQSSLQDYFTKKTQSFYKKNKLPIGYGAIVGAITVNAIRMGIASGMSTNVVSGLKAFGGAILPITVPIILTLTKEKNTSSMKSKAILTGGGLFFLSLPLIVKKITQN